MTIELIIFDCDGVLIDSEMISAEMLRAEAYKHGADISIDYILRTYVGRSYPKVLADLQTQFDIVLPPDFEKKYRERLLAEFEKSLKIMPNVGELIDALNVPYCAATSSSPERVQRSLKLVGLWDRFEERIFTASQVNNGKPAPDLFLFAAKQMGADAQSCIVIEDSHVGVQAGLAAGMTTLRFTGGSHVLDKDEKAGSNLAFDDFTKFFDHYPNLKR